MGYFNKEKYKFEVYKDTKKELRFRMKAPNGEIILVSEGYKNLDGLKDTLEVIKKFSNKAEIVWEL